MKSKHLKMLAATFALTGYLFASLFGMFHMAHMGATHMTASDCPYAMGTQSMCPMSFFDHIAMWQTFSNVVVPSLVLLLIAAAVIFFVFTWFIPLLLAKLRLYAKRQRTPPVFWQQELFSQGILNPKLF